MTPAEGARADVGHSRGIARGGPGTGHAGGKYFRNCTLQPSADAKCDGVSRIWAISSNSTLDRWAGGS
jgi:hypothetical protein